MRLSEYLDFAGALACNVNGVMPALSDIGYGWRELTAAIDAHQLFYCKAWRGRTLYLSPRAYYLLKACRVQRPMGEDARQVYALLDGAESLDVEALRALSGLPRRALDGALGFLLRELHVTALHNGRQINDNWSTFCYGTAAEWERRVPPPAMGDDPEAELRGLWGRTMPLKEVEALIR